MNSFSSTLFSLISFFALTEICLSVKNLTLLRIEPSKRQAYGQAFGAVGPATCGPLPAGCAAMPVAALPPAPAVSAAPMPTGRLIPQALPSAPCEPGVECTGGSICSQGICLCPPELVQEGTVCVSRTIYGVVPPPPVAAVPPPPIPVAYYPSPLPPPIPAPIAPAPMPIPAAVVAPYPVAAAIPSPCIPPYGRFRAACVRRDGEQIQNEGILYNLDDDGSNSVERDVEWRK
uniref:EB domain-containing protein n=1 Tax=Meloidogyne hapla TaxID=6305 RepID=A0A1I8BHH6_MELHA